MSPSSKREGDPEDGTGVRDSSVPLINTSVSRTGAPTRDLPLAPSVVHTYPVPTTRSTRGQTKPRRYDGRARNLFGKLTLGPRGVDLTVTVLGGGLQRHSYSLSHPLPTDLSTRT